MDPSSIDSSLLLSAMKFKLDSLDQLAGSNAACFYVHRITPLPAHASRLSQENLQLKAEVEDLREADFY
jgi:hypothetical protein